MLKYQIYWRCQIYNEDVICALRQWNTLRGLHTQAVCLKLDKVKREKKKKNPSYFRLRVPEEDCGMD